ncbi:MAG TPA: M4 family metallopeptidase [Pyrinomonadaceae bacterium]|nr:M4 family metallopeptidase [Pyrinomonadaceae bacterium]
MKKLFTAITAVLISALFLTMLPLSALAQFKQSIKITGIEKGSDEYERIKSESLKYLDEELGKEEDREGTSPTDFDVISMNRDELGLVHTKVQQRYRGIKVFGGEAIVHLDRNGELFDVTNDVAAEVDEARISAEPRLSAEEAVRKAIEFEGCENCGISKDVPPELVIYAPKADLQEKGTCETSPKLTYKIQFEQIDAKKEGEEPRMPVYFVDAETGDFVTSFDNIQTQSVTNTGLSLYSGNVAFTAFKYNGLYYLENLNRKIGTFNGSTAVRFSDPDSYWDSATQRAAVDAHWGAEKTLEYYGNVYGRNGVNGSGGPLSVAAVNGSTNLLPSKVHYGTNYNNAFWNGNSMTYGDGNGVVFSPLVSLDVVGHELTHGVTQFSAGLIYSGQSGGLNEAVSDIFGNMIERSVKGQSANTWKVGEEIYTPGTGGDALRYMDNPHADSHSIDHYSEYYNGLDVHYSSGIANKEFYLLSQGGTHHLGGSMTGIGADRAAAIWYYALTNFMTSGTNFLGARNATISAAQALYGQTEALAVAKSWCLVGVGACGSINYRARVKVGIFNIWLPWVSNGATAGTTGQSRPMRATQITVNNLPGVGVTYRAHLSNLGWLSWVSNGATAGQTNVFLGQQMEAVQVKLTNVPPTCHVNYRAHVAYLGWLPWVSDGATAGTTGQSRRMEAMQAVLQCP